MSFKIKKTCKVCGNEFMSSSPTAAVCPTEVRASCWWIHMRTRKKKAINPKT